MSAPSDSRSKIVWDDAHVRTARPDAWTVTGTREEIVLLFGTARAPYESGEQEEICLTDRIVLSPFVAKRLALALDSGIRHHEARYGPLPDPFPEPSPGAPAPSSGRAERLIRLVRELGGEAGFERSFKIFHGTLLGNRFLAGVSRNALGQEPLEKILPICERIEMPDDLLETLRERLPDSDYVHFGFEENEGSCVYKVYLEFYEHIQKERKSRPSNRSDRFVLHLGFKWDPSDTRRRALATYTWHPSLSVEDMQQRLSTLLDPVRHGALLGLAESALALASLRVPSRDILYLEVTEEGNPRRSFDINVYRAGLQLGELYPLWVDICGHYAIPLDRFRSLYDPVKHQAFGHLAGGLDREGRDFLTVYYGVKGMEDMGAQSLPPGQEPSLDSGFRTGVPSRPRSSFTGVESRDEKAGLLFSLINALDVKVGLERSFKLFAGTLLADRFLLGFRRRDLGEDPAGKILPICRRIAMPEDFLQAFQRHLPESNIVLFGFEGNENNRWLKAYLEFGDRIVDVMKENQGRPGPFPIHLAMKWDASDNSRKILAEYTCFPEISLPDIRRRLRENFYAGNRGTPLEIVEAVLLLAAGKADPSRWIYFEAHEPDNPRTSFDINLYRAGLHMKELYPLLLDMVRHYAVPSERFQEIYDAVSSQLFGHLTGGADRQGRDFLTVYFGEKGSSDTVAGGP